MALRTCHAANWQANFTSAKTPFSGFWRKPTCARIDWNAIWPATIRTSRPKRLTWIGLYLTPPQHAAVFCVDEKTAIQALDRLDPVLPLSPVRRNGTLSLYAALDVKSGKVQGKTAERHTSAEFVRFLEQVGLWMQTASGDSHHSR
jgi:hypothetical protein